MVLLEESSFCVDWLTEVKDVRYASADFQQIYGCIADSIDARVD